MNSFVIVKTIFYPQHRGRHGITDLDFFAASLKRRKVHMLTKAIREKLQRSRGLLSRAGPDVVDRILFSDEKLFTIQEVSNPQNDRIISSSVQDIPEHL